MSKSEFTVYLSNGKELTTTDEDVRRRFEANANKDPVTQLSDRPSVIVFKVEKKWWAVAVEHIVAISMDHRP